MVVVAILGTALCTWIFDALGSWGPLADAWIFTGSLLATFGMAKGWTEFWLIWIGVDLVGVRGPLLAGLVLMSVGALVAAVAPTFEVLLGARMLQGAGAAAVPTLGVTILSAKYTGEVRGLAFGRLAGVAADARHLHRLRPERAVELRGEGDGLAPVGLRPRRLPGAVAVGDVLCHHAQPGGLRRHAGG